MSDVLSELKATFGYSIEEPTKPGLYESFDHPVEEGYASLRVFEDSWTFSWEQVAEDPDFDYTLEPREEFETQYDNLPTWAGPFKRIGD